MSSIHVTFMINFIKENPSRNKDKKNKNAKGKGKDEKKVKTKRVEIITEQLDIDVEVNVKKPNSYLHIEYNLLPSYPVYKVDVAFWGLVAKIYTSDGMRAMKTIKINGHHWVVFSIKHVFKLSVEKLISLRTHKVNFTVRTSKNKIGTSAKKETVKTFYFLSDDIKYQSDFARAYEIDPNIIYEDMKSKTITSYLEHSVDEKTAKNYPEVIPDKILEKRVLNIINDTARGVGVEYLNSEEIPFNLKDCMKEPKKGKNKNKNQNQKKNKDKKNITGKKPKDILKLTVPGETFYTDPNYTCYDFKMSTKATASTFVIINVKNLISPEQKKILNPVIVKIETLQNVPADILYNHGFSLLYFNYTIGDFDYISGARTILNKIKFKDHRVYFFRDEELQYLAWQIQTGEFKVEIRGIRSTIETNTEFGIFGDYTKDKDLSKTLHNNKELKFFTNGIVEISKKSVLLAVVTYNLEGLLKPVWQKKELRTLLHPQNLYANMPPEYPEVLKKLTINLVNITENNYIELNPLTDAIFLHNDTSLSVEIKLIRPINKTIGNIQKNPNNFNRLVLIVYYNKLAKYLLSTILEHNTSCLNTCDMMPNYLRKVSEKEIQNAKNVITGFVVDSGEFHLMFFEGCKKWIHEKIWKIINKEISAHVKVLFNTDYAFFDRIYADFISLGGIYVVTLKYSVHAMQKEAKLFAINAIPKPCREALMKIDLIMKCTSIREIKRGLFPTARELLSFDIEMGVPLYYLAKD